MLEPVTIDQLRVFVAVVESGSFSAASRKLGRAQSGISQAVATLEDQLGLALFDRSGRRPVLTPEGASLVEDARAAIARVQRLRGRARALSGHVEPSVTLAVSLLVPYETLSTTLGAFEAAFPDTDLRLLVQEAAGPVEAVIAGTANLGVTGTYSVGAASFPTSSLASAVIGSVPIVAVAARDHPVIRGGSAGTAIDRAREERQLLSVGAGGDGATVALSRRTWLVGDQELRRRLVRSGFGWAVMPRHIVADDIERGELTVLDLERHGVPATETVLALHDLKRPLGPAATWIVSALSAMMFT